MDLSWRLLPLAVLLVGARESGGVVDAGAGCPDPKVVEALHAATFHFEHGSPAVARMQLALARELSPGVDEPTVTEVLGRLAVLEGLEDVRSPQATLEIELSRLAFREWGCLPESLHQKLHQALPRLDVGATSAPPGR